MTDPDFLAAFEDGSLPEDLFHHRDHVHAAWLLLREETSAALVGSWATVMSVVDYHDKRRLDRQGVSSSLRHRRNPPSAGLERAWSGRRVADWAM